LHAVSELIKLFKRV